MEIKTDASNIDRYTLENFRINYEQDGQTRAYIEVSHPNGEKTSNEVIGKGSVEVLYQAIQGVISEQTNLLDYQTSSVGGGKDALAESRVQIKINDKRYPGRGTSQDVLEASANAYFNAINRYLMSEDKVTQTTGASI